MAVQTGPLQLRRLNTSQLAIVTPVSGEPVVNTTTKQLVIGDGVTVGGIGVAPTASPSFTGTPVAPTVSPGDNSTKLATTAFVEAARVILAAADNLKAPLASPALTGVPTAPTAAPATNTIQVATTAFVEAARVILAAADALKAPLASPSLTGTPLAPTPAVGTNTTQVATTAMLQNEIANKRAWTAYTPTVTTGSGTYTTVSATGKYMIVFGVCFIQAQVTITTKGTGALTVISLPFPALAGSGNMPVGPAKETAINFKVGAGIINPGGLATLILNDYLGGGLDSANGCIITVSGSYPLA